MSKASGIRSAIDAMDQHQRAKLPTEPFGNDYNILRNLTLKEHPGLGPLLPPEVGTTQMNRGVMCDTPFGEIRTYADQMFQMLGTLEDD